MLTTNFSKYKNHTSDVTIAFRRNAGYSLRLPLQICLTLGTKEPSKVFLDKSIARHENFR